VIRYALRCDASHEFEAWFRSSDDYDRARLADENVCPYCGSTAVAKSIMAPAVRDGRRSVGGRSDRMTLAAPDPREKKLREALKELRRRVVEGSDYVGDRFAEEARRIHFNEVEPRSIHGEATGDEARALADEGIAFQPLPPVPDDAN
jgi:hypothetical protein